jgi:predicted metal-dependent hydrolase
MFQLGFRFFEKALTGIDRRARAEQPPAPVADDSLLAWKHGLSVKIVRRPRARRYLLRLEHDGTARLVIPRRGNRAEALRFLERSETWLVERHRQWQARGIQRPQPWRDGARFLYRGEETLLRIEESGPRVRLHFADQEFTAAPHADYREPVRAHLRRLAERELAPRTMELAREHGITVSRVTVRAQKTRWGSCSARGAISLNWRLVHAPVFVRDYLIIHELMHRREMNHSRRYWKHVAAAFPDYRAAEAWLKRTRLETL